MSSHAICQFDRNITRHNTVAFVFYLKNKGILGNCVLAKILQCSYYNSTKGYRLMKTNKLSFRATHVVNSISRPWCSLANVFCWQVFCSVFVEWKSDGVESPWNIETFRYVSIACINPLNAELNPICHLLILLGDLTFMGPCIVRISNKMQR
jgi:hypothetical protein